jgi:hypothetical protein
LNGQLMCKLMLEILRIDKKKFIYIYFHLI